MYQKCVEFAFRQRQIYDEINAVRREGEVDWGRYWSPEKQLGVPEMVSRTPEHTTQEDLV